MADVVRRHDVTAECSGEAYGKECVECGVVLCWCERAWGHDCEAPEVDVELPAFEDDSLALIAERRAAKAHHPSAYRTPGGLYDELKQAERTLDLS